MTFVGAASSGALFTYFLFPIFSFAVKKSKENKQKTKQNQENAHNNLDGSLIKCECVSREIYRRKWIMVRVLNHPARPLHSEARKGLALSCGVARRSRTKAHSSLGVSAQRTITTPPRATLDPLGDQSHIFNTLFMGALSISMGSFMSGGSLTFSVLGTQKIYSLELRLIFCCECRKSLTIPDTPRHSNNDDSA